MRRPGHQRRRRPGGAGRSPESTRPENRRLGAGRHPGDVAAPPASLDRSRRRRATPGTSGGRRPGRSRGSGPPPPWTSRSPKGGGPGDLRRPAARAEHIAGDGRLALAASGRRRRADRPAWPPREESAPLPGRESRRETRHGPPPRCPTTSLTSWIAACRKGISDRSSRRWTPWAAALGRRHRWLPSPLPAQTEGRRRIAAPRPTNGGGPSRRRRRRAAMPPWKRPDATCLTNGASSVPGRHSKTDTRPQACRRAVRDRFLIEGPSFRGWLPVARAGSPAPTRGPAADNTGAVLRPAIAVPRTTPSRISRLTSASG